MHGVLGRPKAGTRNGACHCVTGDSCPWPPSGPSQDPLVVWWPRAAGQRWAGHPWASPTSVRPPPSSRAEPAGRSSHPGRQTDEGKGADARGRCPRLPAPGHRARGRPSPEVWDEPPPPHSTWALGPWAGSGADWTWGPGTCHRKQRWHSPGRTACFSTPRALNYSQRGQLQTISLSLMEFTLICI